MKSKWLGWTDKGINSILLILLTCIPCIILVIPNVTGLEVGWMCIIGTCDAHYKKSGFSWVYNGFVLVATITMWVNYIIIWREAKKSSRNLERTGSTNSTKSLLERRNRKMTQTILLLTLVCGCCNMASVINVILNMVIMPLIDPNYYEPPACFYIVSSIFEAQFGLNFLIYALKNDQYRSAYIEFWKFATNRNKSIEVQKRSSNVF